MPRITNFYGYLRKIQQKLHVTNDHILACDETSVNFECIGSRTVHVQGARTIGMKHALKIYDPIYPNEIFCFFPIGMRSAGNTKSCFTVMLCAKANGKKFRPFVS